MSSSQALEKSHLKNAKHTKMVGINYLRALASIAVVIWHSKFLSVNNYIQETGFHFDFLDFVDFYLILPAVPLFFLISTFLYAQKNPDFTYTRRRVKRIAVLLVFWTFMLQGFNNLNNLSVYGVMEWLINGGGTLYYFFVHLIILTLFSYSIKSLSSRSLALVFLLSFLPLLLLPVLQEYFKVSLCYHYNPLNFLCYAPLGILAYRKKELFEKRKGTVIFILILMLVGCVLLEFGVLSHFSGSLKTWISAPAPYTRPSLPILSLLYLVIAINIKSSFKFIDYMAAKSSGLYMIHPFVLPGMISLVEKVGAKAQNFLHAGFPDKFIAVILTVIFCYLFLDQFLEKRIGDLLT